ncbi:PKD domain-containing protein [Apibacter raozihei]|uniref:PKD domain-containing protein n=1 Tax=Apibacter raozihei TaxID=2500547 RepID=UPI000FE40D47|nr:PKD domain-containing protein [Apibacter raozihei]
MKRKNILFFILILIFPASFFSQVGMNTPTPRQSFHVDGGGDNTTPTDDEIKNDFIVTKNGSVGIGTITPSDFSALEIFSDSRGLRLPQLKTAERDSLFTSPFPVGLMLYNLDTDCVNISQPTKWLQICCTPMIGKLSISPADGTELKAGANQQFTVSGVTGATSYDWYFNNPTTIPTVITFPPDTTTTYTIPANITSLAVKVVAKGCGTDTLKANYTVVPDCTPPSGKLNSITVDPNTESLVAGSATGYYTFTVIGNVSNVSRYKWTFVSQTNKETVIETSGITCNTYPIEDSVGTLTVTVEALGQCDAATPIKITGIFNVCKLISGNISISSDPSSDSLVAGKGVTFTVLESNVQNKIGEYQWTITTNSGVTTTRSGSSIVYTIPIGTTSLKVEVKASGCNGSEIKSGEQIFNMCQPVSGKLVITVSPELRVNTESTFTASNVVNATSYKWYLNDDLQNEKTNQFKYTPLNTDPVTIKVIAQGCGDSLRTETYTGTPKPACTAMSGTLNLRPANSTVNPGTKIEFTASGVDNVISYKWVVNGEPQSSTTATMIAIINTSQAVNTITVTAKDDCGNTQTATAYVNTSSFACKYAGNFLVPGTGCRKYIKCVYKDDGTLFSNYTYTCPSSQSLFFASEGTGGYGDCTNPSIVPSTYKCPY